MDVWRRIGSAGVPLVVGLVACAETAPVAPPAAPLPSPVPTTTTPGPAPDATETRPPPEHAGAGLPEGPAPRPGPRRDAPDDTTGPISLRSKKGGKCLEVGHEATPGLHGWSWSKLPKRTSHPDLQPAPGPLLQQYTCSLRVTQRFRIVPRADGAFTLRSAASDLCLDAAAMKSDGLLTQLPCNESPGQAFRVERTAGGVVTLIASPFGKCVAAVSPWGVEGDFVQQATCTGDDDQRWVVGP